MEPCDELKNIVLRHYGNFESHNQSETIQEMYSLQEGVTIIGYGADEWFDNRNAIQQVIKEGGSSQLNVEVHTMKAYSEGSVGWTVDQVRVILPDGDELPIRHTRIFHREDGTWKMVHLHVSMGVAEEKTAG